MKKHNVLILSLAIIVVDQNLTSQSQQPASKPRLTIQGSGFRSSPNFGIDRWNYAGIKDAAKKLDFSLSLLQNKPEVQNTGSILKQAQLNLIELKKENKNLKDLLNSKNEILKNIYDSKEVLDANKKVNQALQEARKKSDIDELFKETIDIGNPSAVKEHQKQIDAATERINKDPEYLNAQAEMKKIMDKFNGQLKQIDVKTKQIEEEITKEANVKEAENNFKKALGDDFIKAEEDFDQAILKALIERIPSKSKK